jgi:uncharacterized protein (DUF2235 family)
MRNPHSLFIQETKKLLIPDEKKMAMGIYKKWEEPQDEDHIDTRRQRREDGGRKTKNTF